MFEDTYKTQGDSTTLAINNLAHMLRRVSHVHNGIEGRFGGIDEPPTLEDFDVQEARMVVDAELTTYYCLLLNDLERNVVGPLEGAKNATDLLETLITKAGSEGDRQALDGYVETLGKLARGGRGELADAAVAGRLYAKAIAGGSRLANQELHVRLRAEYELQKDLEGNSTLPPTYTYLYGAVSELSKAGMPADNLIEDYAVNPVRRLVYYLTYLESCKKNDAPATYVADLEKRISDLHHTLPAKVSGDPELTARLLALIPSEDARWQIYYTHQNSYFEMMNDYTVHPSIFIKLLDVLTLVPPSDLSEDHKEDLADLSIGGAETILSNKFEEWKLDSVVGQGGQPTHVIEISDMMMSRDPRRHSEEGRVQLMRDVDAAMAKYAVRYAAIDEYGAAQTFIGMINDPRVRVEAIGKCMARTKTKLQRELLQADSMTLMAYPGIGIHIALQQLLAEDSPNQQDLYSAIRNFVRNPDAAVASDISTNQDFAAAQHTSDAKLVARALRRLDPAAALQLARSLADEITANANPNEPKNYRTSRTRAIGRQLAGQLVRLGDPKETRERYNMLYEASRIQPQGSLRRFSVCMSFADLLFDRAVDRS